MFETQSGYPPFSVHQNENILTIKISIFNLKANVAQKDDKIIITLNFSNDLKNGSTIFNMSPLFAGNVAHNKGKLLIILPQNAVANLVDISKSNHVVAVEIPL